MDKPVIMVIEDEQLLLEAIEKKLVSDGMGFEGFKTGEEAIKHLENTSDYPDVIWLDYYLTDMDGLDFMSKLKENENWSKIPVVVVSNSASPDKVSQMLVLGVKEYILKAENRLDDIIATINKYVEDSKGK